MLVIRREQMLVLSNSAISTFHKRLEGHIRTCWPHRFQGRDCSDVRGWIERCVARAGSYDIKAERDIVRYLDSQALMGEGFEDSTEESWAQDILSSAKLSPQSKAFAIWEGAKQQYRRSADDESCQSEREES